MDLKATEYEGVSWIRLAYSRVQWESFMNTAVWNFGFRKGGGISCPAEPLLASQEEVGFTEWVDGWVGRLVGWLVGWLTLILSNFSFGLPCFEEHLKSRSALWSPLTYCGWKFTKNGDGDVLCFAGRSVVCVSHQEWGRPQVDDFLLCL
jgi:hypothetical protein